MGCVGGSSPVNRGFLPTPSHAVRRMIGGHAESQIMSGNAS
jgi:hypothetical protein